MRHAKIWGFFVALLVVLCTAAPAHATNLITLVNSPSTTVGLTQSWAATPERVTALPRFEIAKIRSGLLPGVVIGGHYEGVLKILRQRYTASEGLSDRLEAAIRQVLETELLQARYEVVGADRDSVFEEQLIRELEPGRLLVGGTITQAAFNCYSSILGDLTRDQRTVRWEVFDRHTSRVVYQLETSGTAASPGLENPAATYEAVRASFQAFLAQPDLTKTLQGMTIAQPVAPSVAYEIPALPSASQPLSIEAIARRAIPSVVWIRTPTARGSGFLLDAAGLVLTNQHVVGSTFSVQIDFYDGSSQTGRVVKRDAALDVALVQLEASTDIPGLPLCHTNAVKVGERVVAIGNPLSLANTVTQGIISGFRTTDHRNLIQTDTAVNPGNSGGPLLNQQGVVVGMVTEKIASRGVEGLSFALPISDSLQKMNVKVKTPVHAVLDPCGNPIA